MLDRTDKDIFMAHISLLALFDHLLGQADLTAQESEHLQDCADCCAAAAELRSVIHDSSDLSKSRRLLVEEENPPLPEDPPKELHPEVQELDERPGRR